MTNRGWSGPVFMLLCAVVLAGCARGQPRERRPVVIIPDMEVQPKFRSQGSTPSRSSRKFTVKISRMRKPARRFGRPTSPT